MTMHILSCTVFCGGAVCPWPLSASKKDTKERTKQVPYKLSFFEHILGLTLVLITVGHIYIRFARGVGLWLLQPCHYLTVLLACVVYWPLTNHPIFNAYMYAHWQGYFALAFANMSWYMTSLEVAMFYVQHYLMILVPWYYLFCTKKFMFLSNSLYDFVTIYALTIVYHGNVLLPMAYIAQEDFDNMLCPVPGLANSFIGMWWRELMPWVSLPFALLVCYCPKLLMELLYHIDTSKKKEEGKSS